MNFWISGASILGRDHAAVGKNNQDAMHWVSSDQGIAAVVCDGCGSSKYSEVGAQIGARLIATELAKQFNRMLAVVSPDPEKAILQDVDNKIGNILERVRQDVLAQIRNLANSFGGSFTTAVNDYFLFTTVGAVILPRIYFTFYLGDGVILVNGEARPIRPVLANSPPYLSYSLLDNMDPQFQFDRHEVKETKNLQTLLIATDGAANWADLAEKKIPGKLESVGPISQFWTENRFLANPDMMRRRLWLMNHEITLPDWKNQVLNPQTGLLRDDTTLICIKRTPEEVSK